MKKKKNGREEKGSVIVGGWYEGRMAAEGHREYLESEEVFLIMVVEVVMWLYKFVKTHRTL